MWLASKGAPGEAIEPSLVLWSLLGLALGSAGAKVFNNWYDQDIDQRMDRTAARPLPNHKLSVPGTLIFGGLLSLAAFLVLAIFVNILAALLTMLAIFTYGYLYTVVLKRRTPLATEIGGISGSLPPLIGWASVKGGINFEALLLFSIMFLWQPPHFWSLATKYREDYMRAGIPTMPVLRSVMEIQLRSLIYVCCLVAVTFFPYIIGMFGSLYGLVALAAGFVFVLLYVMALISRLNFNKKIFVYSIVYLSVILIAMIVDVQKP